MFKGIELTIVLEWRMLVTSGKKNQLFSWLSFVPFFSWLTVITEKKAGRISIYKNHTDFRDTCMGIWYLLDVTSWKLLQSCSVKFILQRLRDREMGYGWKHMVVPRSVCILALVCKGEGASSLVMNTLLITTSISFSALLSTISET